MGENELTDKINRSYLAVGYVLFVLIIGVFAFLFKNLYTGNVGLSIKLNEGVAGWKVALVAGLFVGMLYLTYHYFFRELGK